MWGDLCLRHIPGAARTWSRDIPSGMWLASIRHGGDRVSRQHAHCSLLLCQRKSPEKPGMRWTLTSVTHAWPRVSRGLSCTGIPHIPSPVIHSQAALALQRPGEKGQREREIHCIEAADRNWEQQGERLHASLLRPRADHPANAVSSPGVPSKSPLAFRVP